MHIAEWIPVYFLPVIFLSAPAGIQGFFLQNAKHQLALFLPIVCIPAFYTERMAYVDIGWPIGLVILAVNVLRHGTGWWLRKWLVGGCLLVHGGRMALGAVMMFGEMTQFTYRFREDLPRYQYARVRWETKDKMPASGWWLKMQHDILQQSFLNMTALAAPAVLASFNDSPQFHQLEVAGLVLWAVSWILENVSDGTKMEFIKAVAAKRKEMRISGDVKADRELREAVLGLAPWDGTLYFMWTLCRHPNYFFEWCCWVSFVLVSLPALFAPTLAGDQLPPAVGLGFLYANWVCIRFFYDCLIHWTGAEPAEHFSVLKRPAYKRYQEKTRCFFPVAVPFFDHHQVAGWPKVSK
eukprot:gene25725-31464_t